MDKETAGTIINVFAILCWVGAVFGVLGALGGLFFSSMMGGYGGYGMMGAGFAGFGIVYAIVMLVLSVFEVVVGFGLWNRQEWSRIASLVLSVIALIGFPIGTIIGAFGIWFFGFEETAKKLFTGKESFMDTAKGVKKKIAK